jgi:hypothetical protein
MENDQQEKMHLQEHQRKGGGSPPASIPEVVAHGHTFYQKLRRPAHEIVRTFAIL